MQQLPQRRDPRERKQRAVVPHELQALDDLRRDGRLGSRVRHVARHADASQHERRVEERQRVEDDRKRRGQQLDKPTGQTRADQCRRRLTQRDLGIGLDQAFATGQLRKQHLVRAAADDVRDAAKETDDVKDLHGQRAGERGQRNYEQRQPPHEVRRDHDRELAYAVEQHARVQRNEREGQRFERDEDAHLQRGGVQKQRRRQRQRKVGDLATKGRDRQRRPKLPEIRRKPEPAKRTAYPTLQAIHYDTCQGNPDNHRSGAFAMRTLLRLKDRREKPGKIETPKDPVPAQPGG